MPRIKALFAALVLALTAVFGIGALTPASADRWAEKCQSHAGDWKAADFCLVIRYERATDTDQAGDYTVLNTKLVVRSPYSNSELGYDRMYNIDYTARETVAKYKRSYLNGSTNTRVWEDVADYRCFDCDHVITWEIGWVGWWDGNGRITISLD